MLREREASMESKDPYTVRFRRVASGNSPKAVGSFARMPCQILAVARSVGSFDCVAVRFASDSFAQDDTG